MEILIESFPGKFPTASKHSQDTFILMSIFAEVEKSGLQAYNTRKKGTAQQNYLQLSFQSGTRLQSRNFIKIELLCKNLEGQGRRFCAIQKRFREKYITFIIFIFKVHFLYINYIYYFPLTKVVNAASWRHFHYEYISSSSTFNSTSHAQETLEKLY